MKNISIKIFLFALLVSCNENIEDQDMAESRNIMRFQSISHINSVTSKITTMTDQQLDAWEKENSFLSYRSVLNLAKEEWTKISTLEEQFEFLMRYEDILSIRDSTLIPSITIPTYQSIVNREGIYETNGYLNKVVGDFIVSVPKNDYYKLKTIRSIENAHSDLRKKNELKIVRFTNSSENNEARINGICSSEMKAEYYYNMSGCRDDRKVFLVAKSYLVFSNTYEGDWRQPRVLIEVTASYRNGWCNWWGQTDVPLSYRNVAFTIMAWVTQNGIGVPYLHDVVLENVSETPRYRLLWDKSIGNSVLNQLITASPFTSFHGEASSRGVNNNWAIIDCQ